MTAKKKTEAPPVETPPAEPKAEKKKKVADDVRDGSEPEEGSVAAVAVLTDGKTEAKIDKHGRPETNEQYEGD